MPTLDPTGLRPAQIKAVENLEHSFKKLLENQSLFIFSNIFFYFVNSISLFSFSFLSKENIKEFPEVIASQYHQTQ